METVNTKYTPCLLALCNGFEEKEFWIDLDRIENDEFIWKNHFLTKNEVLNRDIKGLIDVFFKRLVLIFKNRYCL